MGTIAQEITRIQGAKADLKTSIEAKGVTVPAAALIDDYSTYVDAIQTGGSPVLVSLTANDNGTYYPGVGVDGYNEVIVQVGLSGTTNVTVQFNDGTYKYANPNASTPTWKWAYILDKDTNTVTLTEADSTSNDGAVFNNVKKGNVIIPLEWINSNDGYNRRWTSAYALGDNVQVQIEVNAGQAKMVKTDNQVIVFDVTSTY